MRQDFIFNETVDAKNGSFCEKYVVLWPLFFNLKKENFNKSTIKLNKPGKLAITTFFNHQCLIFKVEFSAASLDFDSAIDLDSTLAVAFYNRGMVKYRLERPFGK